jgi:hypothetical protein
MGAVSSLNRSNETDNVKVTVGLELVLVDLTGRCELFDKAGPLGTKRVGTSERTVTTADSETVDAVDDKVASGTETTLTCADWRQLKSWASHPQEGQRDEPIRVPPSPSQPRTSSHPTRTM